MDFCQHCKKAKITTLKKLKCKFCDKKFCSLGCLVKHSQSHTKSTEQQMSLLSSLKRKQSESLTELHAFITPGTFNESNQYEPELSYENLEKVTENFFPVELGSGSFGRVYLVKHKTTGQKYAMKVIEKKKLMFTYGKLDMVYNEINIHSKLNHKNIIRLYNVQEDEDKISMVLELGLNGNLFEKIQQKKSFSEKRAFYYFIQVVNAVLYLHQNNIIHRDIKPENLLLDDSGELKLCDFGWAQEINMEKRSTFCGTIEYMAPEMLESENYDFAVDVWSLGILLYEMLMGRSPFKGSNSNTVINNIKSNEIKFEKKVSKECEDLIKKLLKINPEKRIKLKDVIEHPFVKKYEKNFEEIAEKFSTVSPKKVRIKSCKDVGTIQIPKSNSKLREIEVRKMKKNGNHVSKCLSTMDNSHIIKLPSFGGELKDSIKLEKIRQSLNCELEKARKNVKVIMFKNAKVNSFEDIRDKAIRSSKVPFKHKDCLNMEKSVEEVESERLDTEEDTNFGAGKDLFKQFEMAHQEYIKDKDKDKDKENKSVNTNQKGMEYIKYKQDF